MKSPKEKIFTPYQIFVIAMLAFLQFSVILDFMVLAPLGVILMKTLSIPPSKFSMVVSAYAFAAGASSLLAAGFADRFDRKKLLMFFYSGFILGTALCGLAPDFNTLLIARIITGIFGGVIGSIGFAIITDLFKMEVRGRVMGFVQMSFAASQVLGIPIGLLLANRFGWHSCFWMIAGLGSVAGVVMFIYLKPVTGHLQYRSDTHPLRHLLRTVSKPEYAFAFLTMTLLASAGFMLMPFGSAFTTHNLGLSIDQLPMMYLITGIFSIALGPIAGKLSDKIGKYKLFVYGTIVAMITVGIYTQLGVTPFWLACIFSVAVFASFTARMIPASALMTAIPSPEDRGAFMSVNAAVMQSSGGLFSVLAGMIVTQSSSGMIEHYDILGYTVIGLMGLMTVMMYRINSTINKRHLQRSSTDPISGEEAAIEMEIATGGEY